MNTIVTFGVVLLCILAAIALAAPEPISPGRTIPVIAVIAVFCGVGFYPLSKTLWSAIDLILVPLEAGEVDPRFDPHVSIDGTRD